MCPPYRTTDSVDDLVPYFKAIARRPYNQGGLWPAWDLQPGERVVLRADSWHDPLVIEAASKVIRDFGCELELIIEDRGSEPPAVDGHDEIEIMFDLTKRLADEFKVWEEMEASGKVDKVIWGFGGPILRSQRIKVTRFPFISREMVMTDANTMPPEILIAVEDWLWDRIRAARAVHITDPEGTDVRYTVRDDYYDADREYFNPEYIARWYPQNPEYARTMLRGHLWGKPNFLLPEGLEDGEGVVAGTMNHIGPYPHMRMQIKNSKITSIEGGGLFGDKLRTIQQETDHIQYPGMPGKGLLYWWEASIGTNPKVHRPRQDYLTGHICGLYERMRSGIIHIGFGSDISSAPEKEAVEQGLPHVGHWHVHLNYPTYEVTYADGSTEQLIRDGRLRALDDPGVREIAAKYGDPDELLAEAWVPAVPGLNIEGDYWRDYAQDPTRWVKAELEVCQNWHPLYMKMIQTGAAREMHADHAHHH